MSIFVIFVSDSKIFARFTLIYALINVKNAHVEGERGKRKTRKIKDTAWQKARSPGAVRCTTYIQTYIVGSACIKQAGTR